MVETVTERVSVPLIRRISWAAILSGLAVTFGIQFLLSLLGVGIGASTIHPTSPNGASSESIGIGSIIWFVVVSLISLYGGGWVAGRFAGVPSKEDVMTHGLVLWSLSVVLTIFLLSTAVGGILSGVTGALGSLVSAAGSNVATVAPEALRNATDQASKNGVTLDSLTSRVQQMLSETGNPHLDSNALKAVSGHEARLAKHANAIDPNNVKGNTNELVYRFLHDTGTESSAADRRALINVVAAEQHVSRDQAAATVDGWAQDAKEAQAEVKQLSDTTYEKAKQAGDVAAATVTKAALFGFVFFLCGAVAAAFGALLGVKGTSLPAIVSETRSSRL